MNLAKMRSELAELKVLASGKRRADIYLSRADWSDGLREWDSLWRSQIASSENPYEWLLQNLDRAPPIPLKPKYAHLSKTSEGCRELYEMTKGLKR